MAASITCCTSLLLLLSFLLLAIFALQEFPSPLINNTGIRSLQSLQPGWNFSYSIHRPHGNSSSYLFTNNWILSSPSNSFSLGFCTMNQNISAIFFCIWQNETNYNHDIYFPNQIVWRANAHKPINRVANLSVTADHMLILTDEMGPPVWSVSDVGWMEMMDSGNLVLFNVKSDSVWQSFYNPTDTLLPTQTLETGMKLNCSSSLYSVGVELGGLVFYVNLQQSLPFWLVTPDLSRLNFTVALQGPVCNEAASSNLTLQGSVLQFLASSFTLNISFDVETSSRTLLRLQDDGYFYTYTQSNNALGGFDQQPINLLSSSVTFIDCLGKPQKMPLGPPELRNCFHPNSCGPYGICSFSPDGIPNCSCPLTDSNKNYVRLFDQIDPTQANKGCSPVNPFSCNSSDGHNVYEIPTVTFVSLRFDGWNDRKSSLEECKTACDQDCSCAAIFYRNSTSVCLSVAVDRVMSMIRTDDSDYAAFVKVQKPKSNQPTSSKQNPSDQKHGPKKKPPYLLITLPTVTVTTLFFAGLTLAAVLHFGKKNTALYDTETSDEDLLNALPSLPRRFTLRELEVATNGFRQKLGVGGSSSVYEGVVSDGRRVAVKKLDRVKQGQKQFLSEVATISGSSHLNVVRLYGYCSARPHRLLVYEYMDNGSLDRWLFEGTGNSFLNWERRFDVAVGTAQGIAYLHDECREPVLHLDIKPQNILLDARLIPKLADFGLSRQIDRDSSGVMTQVRGTPGYIAPEWLVSHATVTKKCDVYSFGMVLLELVCGRKIVELSKLESEEWHLPSWVAVKYEEGKAMEVVDERLGGSYDEEGARRMIKVGLWCIQEDPKLRPHMREVVKMLQGKMEVEDPQLLRFTLSLHKTRAAIQTTLPSSTPTTALPSSSSTS